MKCTRCDPSALFFPLQYKYKLDHEKQKGHYVGTRTAKDDNKIRWALIAGKIQNEREYRLPWAKWKTKFQSPADMLSITHSKHSQTLVSDIDYHNYLHQWTCLPDQNDVIQAKKAYELQSDVSGLRFSMCCPIVCHDSKKVYDIQSLYHHFMSLYSQIFDFS